MDAVFSEQFFLNLKQDSKEINTWMPTPKCRRGSVGKGTERSPP
jgi:hypothetical protein